MARYMMALTEVKSQKRLKNHRFHTNIGALFSTFFAQFYVQNAIIKQVKINISHFLVYYLLFISPLKNVKRYKCQLN